MGRLWNKYGAPILDRIDLLVGKPLPLKGQERRQRNEDLINNIRSVGEAYASAIRNGDIETLSAEIMVAEGILAPIKKGLRRWDTKVEYSRFVEQALYFDDILVKHAPGNPSQFPPIINQEPRPVEVYDDRVALRLAAHRVTLLQRGDFESAEMAGMLAADWASPKLLAEWRQSGVQELAKDRTAAILLGFCSFTPVPMYVSPDNPLDRTAIEALQDAGLGAEFGRRQQVRASVSMSSHSYSETTPMRGAVRPGGRIEASYAEAGLPLVRVGFYRPAFGPRVDAADALLPGLDRRNPLRGLMHEFLVSALPVEKADDVSPHSRTYAPTSGPFPLEFEQQKELAHLLLAADIDFTNTDARAYDERTYNSERMVHRTFGKEGVDAVIQLQGHTKRLVATPQGVFGEIDLSVYNSQYASLAIQQIIGQLPVVPVRAQGLGH